MSHADARAEAFQECRARIRAQQWAQTSKFQELKEASQAGDSEQARTAAKLRAGINGKAACADHAALLRPFHIDLGFYSE